MTKLIARLEEMNAALNVSPSFYTVRRPEIAHPQEQLAFRELLPREESEPQILLVIGHKCAGKTTLSDYLAGHDGVMVFEASSVLRQLASDAGEGVDTADDAFSFLREHGLDCVAEVIAKYLDAGEGKSERDHWFAHGGRDFPIGSAVPAGSNCAWSIVMLAPVLSVISGARVTQMCGHSVSFKSKMRSKPLSGRFASRRKSLRTS